MDTDYEWEVPAEWTRIQTIDAHAGGEPLRIVTGGLPPTEGASILEKRRRFQDQYDEFRTSLMWEPRGHADMYGAIPTAPVSAEADLGVLFIHNDGYSTMCGHGIIALVTAALETGMVAGSKPQPTVRLDTPAGLVRATATMEDDRVERVAFENVPSFVAATDREVSVPGYGTVTYDIAYGGAFYVYCDASSLGIGLTAGDASDLIDAGRKIKQAVEEAENVTHPDEDELGFIYGTIFIGPPAGDTADSRNVCVFADGEIDRCPTGTGMSGRLALRYERGDIAIGEPFVVESIIGSEFTAHVHEVSQVGEYNAVIPVIEGSAHLVGRSEFVIDPEDPFGNGFFLR